MNTIIKAVVVAVALSAGAVSAQADSYNDLVRDGQVIAPYGTAGSK